MEVPVDFVVVRGIGVGVGLLFGDDGRNVAVVANDVGAHGVRRVGSDRVGGALHFVILAKRVMQF